MKKIPLFILFFFLHDAIRAQSWQWAISGNNSAGGALIEGWAVAAYGNSYGGGWNRTYAPISFGSTTVPYFGGLQSVWVKCDPLGHVLWAGGTHGGDATLCNIAADYAGNLIVFGYFQDTVNIGGILLRGSRQLQFFVAKFDPYGSLLWAMNGGRAYSATGNITTDTAGNVYITSAFSDSAMSFGSFTVINTTPAGHNTDIFVAKLSSSGTVLWLTSFGGTGNESATGIAVASNGNVYVCGSTASSVLSIGASTLYPVSPSSGSALIAKLSSLGTILWGQLAVGRTHDAPSNCAGVASDTSGNVYVAGNFTDTSISFGSTAITKTYPGLYNSAIFLARYTPADTVDWIKTIGSTSSIQAYGVAWSPCKWVWVNGSYQGASVNIEGHMLAPVAGPDPAFIAGYDISGTAVEYSGIASGGDDLSGIACDGSGSVFFSGDYQIRPSFIFGHDTLVCTSQEPYFLAKYSPARKCCTSLCPEALSIHISVSPGDTVCPDSPVIFHANNNCVILHPAYQWTVNGHAAGTGSDTFSYIPSPGDSVACILTAVSCDTQQRTISNVISIYFLDTSLIPSISITINPGDTLCPWDTAVFNAVTSLGGYFPAYAWIKNGAVAGSGSSFSYYPVTTGDSVWCVLTSSYPCLASPVVTSNKVYPVEMPCEGGVGKLALATVEILPNPATNEITIRSKNLFPEGTSIEIRDIAGRIVSRHNVSGNSQTIRVDKIAPGVYECRLIAPDQEAVVKKIAIIR